MKTCVVTGTGSGIGQEVAVLLSHAKEYNNIAMLGRNIEAMRALKNLWIKWEWIYQFGILIFNTGRNTLYY